MKRFNNEMSMTPTKMIPIHQVSRYTDSQTLKQSETNIFAAGPTIGREPISYHA